MEVATAVMFACACLLVAGLVDAIPSFAKNKRKKNENHKEAVKKNH